MSFADAVADPLRVHRQIDLLAARADARRLEVLEQDGVRFSQIVYDRERAAALLHRALADASYRPGTARIATSFIAGKWRKLARLGVVDMLAHGVVAEVLGEQVEPRLSPHVYSYRPGRSPWQALRALTTFVRAHRAKHPDVRTRGLYVLRSDVKSYAPTIPLDDDSPMWRELAAVTRLDARSPHWAMLRALVLQDLLDADGNAVSRMRGVLFGAPTSNALMNLYLAPLDDALAPLGGAYTRFGDDVLFAHEDADVVRGARAKLEAVLDERRLAVNADKLRVLYWNGAPRASSVWSEAAPVSSLPFLGASIGFDGTIALSPPKWRVVLTDLRERITRTAAMMREEDAETRARALAEIVNDAFDLRSELGLSHKMLAADLVSDRRQLAQLDYLLALWIAEAATGSRGVRAFRAMPYAWIRREAGLLSRIASRNDR